MSRPIRTAEDRSAALARMREAIAALGLPPKRSASKLARMLGITPQAASSWLRGESLPSDEKAAEIERRAELPKGFILGSPETSASPDAKRTAPETSSGFFISSMRASSPAVQEQPSPQSPGERDVIDDALARLEIAISENKLDWIQRERIKRMHGRITSKAFI